MDSPEKRATRAQNIRTLWETLLAPNWTKDDLIDLGKAIFARTPLKRFDPVKFDRLFPHLVKITEALESKITPVPTDSPSDAPESPAGPADLAGPDPCPTGPTSPTRPLTKLDDARLGHGPTGPAASPDSSPQPHHREK